MKSFITKLCTGLGSIMLIVALLIMSIEMFALNPAFFDGEYKKLGTAQNIGMSEEDLQAVTRNLLDYTAGVRESLDMQANINGQQREVFIDKTEKDHMVDVRALYLSARDVRTVCLIGAAVLFVLALILGGKKALRPLCRSFLWVSGGFVVVVAALAVYAAVDFTGFWINFHHVFFSNDLWILDPRTSILIQMVPEQFFSDLVARIIIRFVSMFAALNIAAAAGAYMIRKSSREKAADA
jgi:integral membrane protein (TIGR01906 family)